MKIEIALVGGHSLSTSPRPHGTGVLRNGNPPGDLRLAPRCGARTRAGCGCRQPAMANGRCRLHGGRSTGPRTVEGRERCRRARQTHGLRGAPFIALRREAMRRRKRMDALCAEGKAHIAFRHGLPVPREWERRVATGTTLADLMAAEVRASKTPRRPSQDPRVGYQPRGTRPVIDDLGRMAALAGKLVRQTRAIQARGKDPDSPPLYTATVTRVSVAAEPCPPPDSGLLTNGLPVGMGCLDDFARVPPAPVRLGGGRTNASAPPVNDVCPASPPFRGRKLSRVNPRAVRPPPLPRVERRCA
jgi:hypothetical protein